MSASRYAEIRYSSVRHNLARIRQLVPQSSILVMLKSNAYGHGAAAISKALPDVDAFGVATIAEGVELRQAGVKQSIVVMTGFLSAEEYGQILD